MCNQMFTIPYDLNQMFVIPIPSLMSLDVPVPPHLVAVPPYKPWTLHGRPRVPESSSQFQKNLHPWSHHKDRGWALDPKPDFNSGSSPTVPAFASRHRPFFHSSGAVAITIVTQRAKQTRSARAIIPINRAPSSITSPNSHPVNPPPTDVSYQQYLNLQGWTFPKNPRIFLEY